MKTKFILFCLLFISIATVTYAQTDTTATTSASATTLTTKPEETVVQTVEPEVKPKKNFWFGPKVGVDLSRFTASPSKIGDAFDSNFQAGLMFQFGKTLYFQPEIYYSSVKTAITTENSVRTNYIKIPTMIGLRFLNLGLFSLHAMGGAQFCFELSNNNEAVATTLEKAKTLTWQLGAGIDVLSFITMDLRYLIGKNNSLSDVAGNLGLKGVNLTIGLKFR